MILLLCGLALALSPDEAVQAALAHDPRQVAADAAVGVAEGVQKAARGLQSNPTLEVAVDAGGDWRSASLTQPLSLSGAGLAAARASGHALEAAEAERARAALETAAAARRAWAVLAAAEGALRAASTERESATALREAASARRAAGAASDLELALAELDEARAAASFLEALAAQTAAQATLAALTGDGAASATGDPLLAAPRDRGGGERADLRAAAARVAAAQATLTQEGAEALPAVGLGVFWEQETGSRRVGPAISLSLPLWQQNGAGRAQAAADLQVAEAEAASLQARVAAEQRAAARGAALGSALSPGVEAAAQTAAAAIAAGLASGQLDPIDAALLRAQVFAGQRGWYAARLAEAEGRIATALASGDPGLLAP